jgi:hypothetical protein
MQCRPPPATSGDEAWEGCSLVNPDLTLAESRTKNENESTSATALRLFESGTSSVPHRDLRGVSSRLRKFAP